MTAQDTILTVYRFCSGTGQWPALLFAVLWKKYSDVKLTV